MVCGGGADGAQALDFHDHCQVYRRWGAAAPRANATAPSGHGRIAGYAEKSYALENEFAHTDDAIGVVLPARETHLKLGLYPAEVAALAVAGLALVLLFAGSGVIAEVIHEPTTSVLAHAPKFRSEPARDIVDRSPEGGGELSEALAGVHRGLLALAVPASDEERRAPAAPKAKARRPRPYAWPSPEPPQPEPSMTRLFFDTGNLSGLKDIAKALD
jgi:hypothetical protein